MTQEKLEKLAQLIRYDILVSSTEAGSGHPSSSLSAVELMTALLFGGTFRFDPNHPGNANNDRLIFSKGHASPLFYALWATAGAISAKELMSFRRFSSPLEGHPVPRFPYTEAATGSLGQGLSIGLGMALNAKIDRLPYRTYVLLGDGEMAEGAVWEAIQLAVKYRLDNLVGIIDVNRLDQVGETMLGHDLQAYAKRISSFGWQTLLVDGHSLQELQTAYRAALKVKGQPVMIIAKTIKGKGVPLFEDKNGRHGKVLNREQLQEALRYLGSVDASARGEIARPEAVAARPVLAEVGGVEAGTKLKARPVLAASLSTRQAYGEALVKIYPRFPEMVVLDAGVSNSTYAATFQKAYPGRFFEMYIAEQNMVGAAVGLARRGKIPFVSSFAAFLTRAADQIRMAQYSQANIKFAGSHAGVSIGEDGPSQMGLEDLALFRTLLNSVVLYPADTVATERLVAETARHQGLTYLRLTRPTTPTIYEDTEEFPIGGSKTLRQSAKDAVTVVAAGITLHEALKAYEALKKEGVLIRVIDLYSLKPIDQQTLITAAKETRAVVTVEDHYAEGGLGEAVMSVLAKQPTAVHQLAVRQMPPSGTPEELLDFEEISWQAIVKKINQLPV